MAVGRGQEDRCLLSLEEVGGNELGIGVETCFFEGFEVSGTQMNCHFTYLSLQNAISLLNCCFYA